MAMKWDGLLRRVPEGVGDVVTRIVRTMLVGLLEECVLR
jgi:hypothetical protein